MKRFLKKLVLFSIPLVCSFYLLDYTITKGLKKTKFDQFSDWNDIFSGSINADIIINGSSRATVHISTQILDSFFNLNSYNLGIHGYQILMELAKYDAYLAFNTPPKIIIHSIESFTLTKRADLYAYTQFLPYLNNPIIEKATKQFIGLDKVDYTLPLFRYRTVPGICKVGLFEYFSIKKYINTSYKGYSGQDLAWTGEFDEFKKNNPNPYVTKQDIASIQLFDQYLAACSKNNIKVFLVYSPEYIEAQALLKNRKEIIALYQYFSKKYNFPFLDYSSDSLSLNKARFYNSTHLNKEGSEIFTRRLANDIKNHLRVE